MTAHGNVKTSCSCQWCLSIQHALSPWLLFHCRKGWCQVSVPGGDSILLVYICCKLHAGRYFLRGPNSLRSLGPILPTRYHWWNLYGWKIMEQPLYSPDLVPNDFHLFGPVTEFLAGKHRHWCEVSCLIFWLQTIYTSFFHTGAQTLVLQRDRP
jgi:hypothetical protein